MNQDNDPWDWTKENKVLAAPLGTQAIQADHSMPGALNLPHPITDMERQAGVNAAAKGMEAGYKAYGAPLSQTAQAANTLGTTASGAPVALANAGTAAEAGSSMYALTPTLTGSVIGGAGTAITPAAASAIGTGIGEGALATGATTTGATALGTAATTGVGAGLAEGGAAALTAMGPVGWAIGAGLLAKKLGIF